MAIGGIEHLVDSLRNAPAIAGASGVTAVQVVYPVVELLHEFAKEGRLVQDNLAMFGGAALLTQFLADYLQLFSEGISADREYVAVEALAALALVTLGSQEGR